MSVEHERRVCDFVREILSARTGESIQKTSSPEEERRDIAAVEELWSSPSTTYAVEHTRVEAFEGQIRNEAAVARLLSPIRHLMQGVIPGDFRLEVREDELRRLPLGQYAAVRVEVARTVLEMAPRMAIGEAVALASPALPFSAKLQRRDGPTSQLLIVSIIEADPESSRFERVRRALAKKLPKLNRWATAGRLSVLVLESNDIQHSNVFEVFDAVKRALAERDDRPDLLVVVETDGGPWYGWVMKEGDRQGDEVPEINGVGYYTQGEVAHLPRYR